MNTFTRLHNGDFRFSTVSGLITQLMTVSHYVHRTVMERLMENRRYEKLHLGYEGYMALLAERDRSPGELSELLGVTRQACSKVLRELQDIGLLVRNTNPRDSRSALISLTPKGLELLRDGLRVTGEIRQQFAEIVGVEQIDDLTRILNELCEKLNLEFARMPVLKIINPPPEERALMGFSQPLITLSAHIYESLIAMLGRKGFRDLKPSFSTVMGMIHADEGRIQYIASVTGVSKQAIVATVTELATLGYVTRDPDPNDKRQVILRLTALGEQLLIEGTASIAELQLSVRDLLGDRDYRIMESTLAALYPEIINHLEAYQASPAKINDLSQQLLEKMGVAGARALAHRLMDLTRGES